jgi:serine/threonine-protein kinase PknG
MKCERPGCTGTIEDGYCNVCGMAPATPARTPVAARAGSGAPSTPSAAPSISQVSAPSRPSVASAPGSSRPSGVTSGTTGSGSGGSRRTGSGRTRGSRRSHLGAGLVEVPPVAYRDPSTAIMTNAVVAEDKRYCAHCGEPVGRGRDGKPGRAEGFCRKCGHAFSFSPKLAPGDLVAGQYEVVGCLAHGGLGWIYLARDRNVSDRWVVLKGLLDSGDEDAMEAAVAERRFLAEVEHPNIVKIFNFVQHKGAGYIVMEYVGGDSLKDLLKQRRDANNGKPDPLPVTQAIAYMVEILPALGYLHKSGLVYCDFKPDNVIQQDDLLKLIDMGGVRRMDDQVSAVYGTVGYQAPEIADVGPSVASDLFTVGRSLAVLTLDFKGYQSTYKYTLPDPADVPLFRQYDSLFRALRKSTATNPDDRFQSAEEMGEQLVGVLREIVAASEGTPRPAASTVFTGDFRAKPAGPDWRLLPALRVGAEDPAAAFLATITVTEPAELIDVLRAAPVQSSEIQLRLARASIESGDFDGAETVLEQVANADPWDWRVTWYRGLSGLANGQYDAARTLFDSVYADLPGELAPKLAVAVAAESAGDFAAAALLYDVVSRTDPAFTTACFGLARCRLASGDRAGAVEAYNRVPELSSSYLEAQIGAARALVDQDGSTIPAVADLTRACTTVDHLALDPAERASLTRDLLNAALNLLRTGRIHPDPQVTVLGEPLTERRLRTGLERAYRALARLAPTADERIRLVDEANQVRPRTLL